MELLSAFVHSSMMPYEQKVSLTLYCDNVESHNDGFASTFKIFRLRIDEN